jgi:D-sedoheptulose 7-phosphate isomerase
MSDVNKIKQSVDDSITALESLKASAGVIAAAGDGLVAAFKAGNKVLTAGNGGSAAEALHMAEELIGRFEADRVSLPGIALCADATALTCIGNDYGFDAIFSRQVEGLGKPGDILVLFSTSGNSRNIILALEAARKIGMKTLCLLGRSGGKLTGKGTWEILVPAQATARIQEAHQVVVHILLEIVEQAFVKPS